MTQSHGTAFVLPNGDVMTIAGIAGQTPAHDPEEASVVNRSFDLCPGEGRVFVEFTRSPLQSRELMLPCM